MCVASCCLLANSAPHPDPSSLWHSGAVAPRHAPPLALALPARAVFALAQEAELRAGNVCIRWVKHPNNSNDLAGSSVGQYPVKRQDRGRCSRLT